MSFSLLKIIKIYYKVIKKNFSIKLKIINNLKDFEVLVIINRTIYNFLVTLQLIILNRHS